MSTSPRSRAASARLGLLGLLGLLGCNERPPPQLEPDDWDDLVDAVPGARLRPIYRVSEDETRVHVAWQDTRYDAPCEFRGAADGVLRCVPLAEANPSVFADPSCTEPAVVDFEVPEGAVVVSVPSHGCIDMGYYELGVEVSELYRHYDTGPCEPAFSSHSGRRVYDLAAEEFVSATVTPTDGNSRIVPLVLEASDGARQIVGAWDRRHDEQVVPGVDASGQSRWFGRQEARVSSDLYGDPTCTVRVAAADCIPWDERPRTAFEVESQVCGAPVTRYHLLDEVGPLYRVDPDRGCVDANPYGEALRAWRLGAVLPAEAFAEAPLVPEQGGRLRHDVYANPEGEPFFSSQIFHDLQLQDAECGWREVPPRGSGSFDCVPRGAAMLHQGIFADAACTQRTASGGQGVDCPDDPPLYAYGYVARVIARIVGVLAVPGSAHYRLDEGDCVPFDPYESDGYDPHEYLVDEPPDQDAAQAADLVE